MMSLTFGLFTQVSGSGPLGPLVLLQTFLVFGLFRKSKTCIMAKFYRFDLVICSHFSERKILS